MVCLPAGKQVPVFGYDIKIWLLLDCLDETTTPKIPYGIYDKNSAKLLANVDDYRLHDGCVTYIGEHSNKDVWVLINEGYDSE